MNPEKQRVAIAEACGWRMVTQYNKPEEIWESCEGVIRAESNLPDYLNDLNAMQSAVLKQSPSFQSEFHDKLMEMPCMLHQASSTHWAEIFIDIALKNGIIKA